VALSVTKHCCFAPTFSNGGLPCVARTFLREVLLAAIDQLAFKYTKKITAGQCFLKTSAKLPLFSFEHLEAV
jgi:hypothetical protein